MSRDPEKKEHSLQHDAEHAKPHKKVSIMGYLAILFAAAFLLLLLSYFMQQRSSQEAISGLSNSVSAMQSVEKIIENNEELQGQVKDLNEELGQLKDQVNALRQSNQSLETSSEMQGKQLTAMDWLWRIQRAYSRGSKSDARTLVDAFEASGFSGYLPNTSASGIDGPSPAEQYDALLDALNYRPDP